MSAGTDAIAGLLDAASSAVVDIPASGAGADSVVTEETPEVQGGAEEGVGGEQTEEKSDVDVLKEELAEIDPTTGQPKAKDALESTKGKTSAALRNQLKAWRDSADKSTPEGRATLAAVKELHQAYERYRTLTDELGVKNFNEFREMHTLMKDHGGVKGMQNFVANVASVDEKLYGASEAGEAGITSAQSLVADIVGDLKSENKIQALGNLASAFVSAVQKELGVETYAKQIALPAIAEGLEVSGCLAQYNEVLRCLKAGDAKAGLQALVGMGSWFRQVLSAAEEKKDAPLSAEAKKLADERSAFNKERFNHYSGEVGASARKEAYSVLAKAIAPIVRSPFFKGLSKVAQQDAVGKLVKAYQEAMGQDQELQRQFKVQWAKAGSSKQAERDAAKERLLTLSRDFVTQWANKGNARKVLGELYPQLLRGGSAAAGRIASKAAADKANAAAVASGNPIYVASKPKDLVRNQDISVGGKEYKSGDLTTLEILGKGFIKTNSGGFKFVTWRK